MKFICKNKTYVLCNTGALGDTISTFPTLKILAERGHIEKLFVPDNYYELYNLFFDKSILLNIKENTVIVPKEKVTANIPEKFINKVTGEASYLNFRPEPNIPIVESFRENPTSIHTGLVDCFSMCIGSCILKDTQKDYPLAPKEKLPVNKLKGKKYVVLCCGSTTEHKRMLPEVFSELKKYFIDKGFEVVLLGNTEHKLVCIGADNGKDIATQPTFDGMDRSGCIDLINQTSVVEALSIIYDAKMVVGVDGGLIHLAGLTDVAIVPAYTTADPYYLLPYRHGVKGWNCFVVEPDCECVYCQTEQFETYGINFTKCPTGELQCVNNLTADKWIKQIEKVL